MKKIVDRPLPSVQRPRLAERSLALKAEELFELWRSLEIRISIDRSVGYLPSRTLRPLTRLRTKVARLLQISRPLANDFLDTYYCHTMADYEHYLFHDQIENYISQLAIEESELDHLSAKDFIDGICHQYNQEK